MKTDTVNTGVSWLGEAWSEVRREWASNVRLRWGVRLIAVTLGVWAALLAQDQADAWQAERDEAQSQLQRLRPLSTESAWPQRADDARVQLESVRALLWPASSQGQAEAMVQDRLRELCAKAGLSVKELGILASDSKEAPEGTRLLRARVMVDMNNRIALMALLSELSQSPQWIVVEALRLRPQAAPPRAEVEVRVLYREQDKVQ